jgi:hypothetical protein
MDFTHAARARQADYLEGTQSGLGAQRHDMSARFYTT